MAGFTREILEQPDALDETISNLRHIHRELRPFAERLHCGSLTQVVISGMGGSYSARYPSLIRLNGNGVAAFGINSAELLHYRLNVLNDRTLLLLVSQSGESVEVVHLAEAWKDRGALIALTNIGDSSLASMADLPIRFNAGDEETVSTKTYTCTLAALMLITGALAGEDVGRLIAQLEQGVQAIRSYLGDWEASSAALLRALSASISIVLLARGSSMASAATGALVLKEAAHLYAEGMNAAEYRHGPLEAAGPEWPAILFMPPGRTNPLMVRLAREILDCGNRVAVVGPECPDSRAFHLPLRPLDESVSPLAEIVPIQTLAYQAAVQRGLEPGRFHRMGKITTAE